MSRGMYDEIEGEKCDGYGLEEGEECDETEMIKLKSVSGDQLNNNETQIVLIEDAAKDDA